MGCKPHTISLSFQYQVTSYHTIGIIETYHIPGQPIPPFHSCHRVSGVLLRKYEIISAGCNTGPLGSIFCGQFLQIFTDILSYKWRLYGELYPLKISSIGLYQFWVFTLWITHHKPLKIICHLINTRFVTSKSRVHPSL